MTRYAEKILTPVELNKWKTDGKNQVNLWSYWALKESAYKIESRQTGLRRICPKRFIVLPHADNSCHITSPIQRYFGRIQRTPSHLFAISGPTPQCLTETEISVFPLSSSDSAKQSAEVRDRLRKEGHCFGENQQSEHTFLSISHHGLWGGYALYQQPVS